MTIFFNSTTDTRLVSSLFYLLSLFALYFRLYIILKGKVSIYVVQDKENDQEIRQHVEKVMAKQKLEKKLDRTQLGQHVWTSSKN